MEKVKFSLLLMHFTTSAMDLVLSLLVQPYIIFTSAAGYPLGLLTTIGVPSVVVMHLTTGSIFSLGPAILMFFEERYNRLLRPDADTKSRRIKRIAYYTFNYLTIFLFIIPTFFTIPNQDEARKLTIIDNPCLPLSISEHPKFFRLTESAVSTVLFMLGYLVFTSTQSVYHFFKVMKYLYTTNALSKDTKRMQKALLKALAIQAQAPIMIILIPVLYLQISGLLRFVDMALSNIGMIIFASHGLFSTLTMLSVHKPYRNATMDVFRKPVTRTVNTSQVPFNSFIVNL